MAAGRTLMHSRRLLFVLWLCFVVRGCFYSALLPLWEGYDEPFHFAFIQYVVAHGGLPVPTTPVSREVQQSLHLLPLSWEERLHRLQPPFSTEDSYWQLSEADRNALEQQVRGIPPQWGSQPGTAPALYEAQQAPLYYWIMAAPLRLASGRPLATRIMLIRVLGVLLASLFIPIAFAAGRRFFSADAPALGTVAVIICMPELMINISRVGNESLAIVFYSLLTLLLFLAVRPGHSRWLISAGVALGLGLLTKAYFLFAIPALLSVAIYLAWRYASERKQILLNTAVGLVLAALISFASYWRNRVVTGNWSGEQDAAVAARSSLPHLLITAAHVNWISGVNSVLISHTWFGGWSFLHLPKWMYVFFAAGMLASAAGVIATIVRRRLQSPQLTVLLALYGWFWVGLLCNVLAIYIARGISASCGWYMYAVIVPEMLLVGCGLYALTPPRGRWMVFPALATAFATIDLYGVFALLMPYYTGIIRHDTSSEHITPATLSQLVSARPNLLLDRLTVNRAGLSPRGVGVLLLAYCVCTAVAVALTYVVMRSAPASPEMALDSQPRYGA